MNTFFASINNAAALFLFSITHRLRFRSRAVPLVFEFLNLILQQCGFTLVDNSSTNRPAIEITGEAFSEFGMSKGNLKSCRARTEIKARDVASGNIISEDRQTSVAVDIAEHIAAKTALQNGAGELAERLLPKLVQ